MGETVTFEIEDDSEQDGPDLGPLQENGDEFHAGKIYCANCIQCKLFSAGDQQEPRTPLRIRCAAGKWKKKLGEEKLYKYSTITRRYLDACDAYEEMGDTREFIRELRKDLSNRDEIYTLYHEGEERNPA